MVEKWSLRLRIFLFFAFIALGSSIIIVASLYFATQRIGDDAIRHLVLFGGIACFGVTGLALWVWNKFDEHVARPIERISRDVRTIVHTQADNAIAEDEARYLGFLNPAVQEITAALAQARTETEEMVSEATRAAKRQKRQLEAVLRDLQQGVLICSLDHRILLYNRRAISILHVSGNLGLGRSLLSIVSAHPFRHALERLTGRFEDGRHLSHKDGLSTMVVCATADGYFTLQGRVTLVLSTDETRAIGYIATFDDVTKQLSESVARDHLLHDAALNIRRPATNIRAAAEILARKTQLSPKQEDRLQTILLNETENLTSQLANLDKNANELLSTGWPMGDVYSPTLFNCIIRRTISENRNLTCDFSGTNHWINCDSVTIVEVMEHVMAHIAKHDSITTFHLEATAARQAIYLDISWKGDIIPGEVLETWLGEPLESGLGTITGRDVLDRHKTDFWCIKVTDGTAHMRLPLLPAQEQHAEAGKTTPALAVPEEFYDFDLAFHQTAAAMEDRPLKELTYVVFDTETTGLEPSNGDEMISIAGVRIVNGRVLRGEVFDAYINPGRNIPPASTKIHHITDAMVADAEPATKVVPNFHRFVQDAVLVAHNAAFDMKFLSMKQDACKVTFDNPVLDTVLLAAHLYGHTDSLTLDTLAEKYGIEIPEEDRHTALGDSIATAHVLLHLINLLEADGIKTLKDAIDIEKKAVAIRKRQAKY